MATKKKPEPQGPMYRRVLRSPAGVALNDATELVKAEALALGWRPVDAPYIESDATEGGEHVVTWAVRIEENS